MTGRAGFDVAHHRQSEGKGPRVRKIKEAFRALDADEVQRQAKRNPNIVADLSANNVSMVNDGHGGFRPATSFQEVIDYGDQRESQVYRKINGRSFTTTTIVAHLPKSMCKPERYRRSDGELRTRWVPRDHDEMMRYFNETVDYLCDEVLLGGQQAVHGYDLNLDETTPHIQLVADTYAPDPKHEGHLRVTASQMWGQHREVTDDKGKAIPAQKKMRGYQAGFRKRMHGAGFDVELDADPVRSSRKHTKEEYVEIQEAQEALEDRAAALEVKEQEHQAREAQLSQLEAAAERAGFTAGSKRGLQEGRKKGYAEGFNKGKNTGAAEAEQENRRIHAMLVKDQRAAQEEREKATAERQEAEQARAQVRSKLDAARALEKAYQESRDRLEAARKSLLEKPAIWSAFLKNRPKLRAQFEDFEQKHSQALDRGVSTAKQKSENAKAAAEKRLDQKLTAMGWDDQEKGDGELEAGW
nr:flagellar assembly protein H [Streptococcus thermophilus]